jgi:hypothetical protein
MFNRYPLVMEANAVIRYLIQDCKHARVVIAMTMLAVSWLGSTAKGEFFDATSDLNQPPTEVSEQNDSQPQADTKPLPPPVDGNAALSIEEAAGDPLLKIIQERAALPPIGEPDRSPRRVVPLPNVPPRFLHRPNGLPPVPGRGIVPPIRTQSGRPSVPPVKNASAKSDGRWRAAESMLRSARWLEEDAYHADAKGNVGDAVHLRGIARSLREQVIQLLTTAR